MVSTTTEESLARWVAERCKDGFFPFVEDDGTPKGDFFVEMSGPDGEQVSVSPTEYLSCKNVAGRLWNWANDINRGGQHPTPNMNETFKHWLLGDTPSAIEFFARACGWEPPTEVSKP